MITPIEELRRRDDAYINNILLQKSQYSLEHIQAATLIFEERGLADPAKQALIKEYPILRKEVLQKHQEGMSAEDLTSYMMAKGLSKQDTLEMIKNAKAKDQKVAKKKNNKIKNRSILIALIVAIIYMTIRLWMRTRQ